MVWISEEQIWRRSRIRFFNVWEAEREREDKMRFHDGRGMECSEKKDKLRDVYDEAKAYREYKRRDK